MSAACRPFGSFALHEDRTPLLRHQIMWTELKCCAMYSPVDQQAHLHARMRPKVRIVLLRGKRQAPAANKNEKRHKCLYYDIVWSMCKERRAHDIVGGHNLLNHIQHTCVEDTS